jgi:hypothetical protein
MDMEEYFLQVQEELEEIIKRVERIGINDYQYRAIQARKEALKNLTDLYNEFEF